MTTRIYTEIVIDFKTGIVERAEFEDYDGPIALAKGGGSVSVPGPSAEERALQAEQTTLLREQRDILKEQTRTQNLLAPYLYKDAGITPILNTRDPATGLLKNPDMAEGAIIDFEAQADPNKEMEQQINTKLLQRSLAALNGELPVDPALLRDLGEQETALRETLRKNLGTGYETSTPGIETLAEFTKRSSELKDAARRGDLSLAESLSLSRQNATDAKLANMISRITGTNTFQFGNQQGYSQIAQGMGNITAQMQQDRGMQAQAAIAQMQAKAQGRAALFSGIGQLAGSAMMAGAIYGSSDRRLKENIVMIGRHALGFGIYLFNFIGEAAQHLGVMADEVEQVRPDLVIEIDGFKAVNYGGL
jgi:hypothetical protein